MPVQSSSSVIVHSGCVEPSSPIAPAIDTRRNSVAPAASTNTDATNHQDRQRGAHEVPTSPTSVLHEMSLQQLRDAYRRAVAEGRQSDVERIELELNFRHSINDYR